MKGNDIKKENRGVKDKKTRNCGFLVITNHGITLILYLSVNLVNIFFQKQR